MSDIKNIKNKELENSIDLQDSKKHLEHDYSHNNEHNNNHKHEHKHADCCCEHPHHIHSESSDEHDHKHIHHNEYDHKHENEYCGSSPEKKHNHEHEHEHENCGCGHKHGHHHEHGHHHDHKHKHSEHDHCCDACAERSKSTLTPTREKIIDTDRIVDLIKIFSAAFLLGCGYIYNINEFFFAAYVLAGYEVIWEAIKSIFRGDALDENFLMLVSTLGAIYVGQYPEATGVMLFYSIGEFFEELAVDKSRRSISDAMDIKSNSATKKVGNEYITLKPEELEIGDLIVVKAGEKIPVDGTVVSGSSSLDTSALTGESIPRKVNAGEEVTSGFINGNGLLEIRVTATFEDSAVGKILEMVEASSSRKTHMEKFITKFAKYYTPIVVGLAILLAIVPTIILGFDTFNQWLYRAMTFLVISCPCALVISVPMSLFAGIGAASSKGMIVKGSSYLEAFARLETIAFDKTGTLTKGIFAVDNINTADGIEQNTILQAAYACEHLSEHPIALAISRHAELKLPDTTKQSILKATSSQEEIPGRGVKVTDGKLAYFAGNKNFMNDIGINDDILSGIEITNSVASIVYVAQSSVPNASDNPTPDFLGAIEISDQIREESESTISKLKTLGIPNILMLTGDLESSAIYVAKKIGLTKYIAQLLPQDKVTVISDLIDKRNEQGSKNAIAFVGDGINDAPVLAISDVGVAMGAFGSDAAIEAADVVMMTDSIAKLPLLVSIAKKTVRICKENIVFAIGIKLIFLALGALGLANLWMAVFADVGVTVLAILNAMRSLKISE